jgi:hypothetical protein
MNRRRIEAARRVALGLTLWTSTPVRDVGFVDLVAVVVGRGKARRRTYGAVDVDETAAVATYEVMVVVIDAILVARGRPDGLNSPDDALVGKYSEGVVDGLARDRADVTFDHLGDVLGRDVGPFRHRSQDGQSLGRHL